MKQTNFLTKLLLLCLCVVGSVNAAWADTETPGNTGTKDKDLSGVSYSIAGTYIAGAGSAGVTPMVTNGVKFRTNKNSNTLVISVKSGYTITGLTIYGIANDNDKAVTVDEITVDGVDYTTDDIVIPNKSASTAQTIDISDISATNNITFTFSTNAGTQVLWDLHFTYIAPSSKYTVSFDAGDHGTYTGGDITQASVGANITLPALTTLADGYYFKGWFTAASGGDRKGGAGDSYKPTSSHTLYAQYNQIVEPVFSLTKSKIHTDGTSQIQVGSTGDLDDVTLVDLTSSNTSVATVDATGLVTAVGAGTTDITFTSNAVTGKYKAVTETVTLTLKVTVADPMSCSAYLSGTSGSPTQTKCTLKFYSSEGTTGTVPAGTQVGKTSYYQAKMNNNANYYEVTLTDGKFKAGDILKVYLYGNNTTGTYILGKTAQTTISETITSGVVNEVSHTLTAAEIEDNGTVRIYRNSSNTYFSGVALSGDRDATPKITAQPEGATYETGADATALSVTATPFYNEGVLTYQWYSNTIKSTEGASAIPSATSSSYTPNTASAGTTYYYCVVTEPAVVNSVTSDIVSIVVVDMYGISTSVAEGQTSRGSVSPSGTTKVAEGESLEITATPEAAYKFQHWIIDDDSEHPVTTNPYTFSDVSTTHTAVAYFVARKVISYNMTTAQKGTRTDDFATEYANDADKWTAPANKYLFSDNQTLKKWRDASSNEYVPGTEYTLTGNITLTPVFADNAEATFVETLDGSKTDFEVSWDFSNSYGSFNMQGTTGYLVKQATINTESVDMPIAISTTTGKLNNVNRNDQWAQINTGTTLTVPVVNGSVVTIKGYKDFTETTINGSTEYEKSGTDGNRIATYTYSGGSTGTIDIVAGEGSGATSDIQYISYITVTYPTTFSPAPSISAGTFSFADKAYPVTITGEEGTTKIETSVDDGANWTNQSLTDLACTVNVTAGQTLLARATVGEKEPSAEVSYTNNFDSGKSYVGWVYGKYSDYSSYNPESDGIYASLKGVYNMVPVSYTSADATPSNDLKNADLLVFSEALKGAGGDVMPNKLKTFVGYVPIINMKVFNYTYNESASSNRWGWATGESNPKTADITPNSNKYKILDGVTFSGNKINFYSGASGNQVQTINDWQAEPTNNVAMGIGSDSKVAMHAIIDNAHLDKQFFGIGLSCDNRDKYTENAKILIKNVAAVLIAGTERLDAEKASVSGTITTTGWNTFSSSYPLDLNNISGGKAYYAHSVNGTDVVLKPATGVVPAGEGLMIKGTPNDPFTIDVADTDGTTIEDNKLVGLPSGGTVAVSTDGSYNYVYAWQTANPSTTYGFYNVNSKAATLGAGKAYLHLPEAIPTSGRVSIIFDDEETTGIKAIDSSKMTVDSYYDLSGRKVAQPTKGLYIVNGKKVIVK